MLLYLYERLRIHREDKYSINLDLTLLINIVMKMTNEHSKISHLFLEFMWKKEYSREKHIIHSFPMMGL